MDPEYEQTLELTEKSDVYSFGVLLLELVTGRRAINDNIRLVDWAQKYMDNVEYKIAFLVDSELERHEYNLDELESLIDIIKQCTQVPCPTLCKGCYQLLRNQKLGRGRR